jgi:circadian clock protein KaiC
MQAEKIIEVKKLSTQISGFDLIAGGGIPKGRTILLSGTAGSGKTVFAAQFLAEGIIKVNEPGVFVTFEESPQDIRQNMQSFGWDIQGWEDQGKWAFVDGSPQPAEEVIFSGDYDLGALLARIEYAVQTIGAKRLVVDSLGAIFSQFTETAVVRREMFKIVSLLKALGVTAVITAERVNEYGDIGRYGVEEFVADNVLILRNVLEEWRRRRTMEILKFRGASHQKGEFSFTIIPGEGIVVIPLSAMELKQKSTDIRISSGNNELDQMCSGGFFRDSVTLVSGATGTGKTLITTEFIAGGAKNCERCLLFAFEESREQLFRNAIGWGVNFIEWENQGMLKVVCEYPEVATLEDHLIAMRKTIEEFKPDRVAIDSLSALERVSTDKGFREFVVGLTSFIKHKEMAGLFTSTTPTLMGGTSVTEAHISTITDLIILLRYVEMYGEMRRGIAVLKMRGSMHDKDIREFTIDDHGMHIGKPFRDVTGILSGRLSYIRPDEMERIDKLFK